MQSTIDPAATTDAPVAGMPGSTGMGRMSMSSGTSSPLRRFLRAEGPARDPQPGRTTARSGGEVSADEDAAIAVTPALGPVPPVYVPRRHG